MVGQSTAHLAHRLSGIDVFLLSMSALSPALSVFVYGGEVLKLAGTGAAIAFIAGAGVAIVWAMIYAELGAAFPHAGGEYAGINGTTGEVAGFIEIAAGLVGNPASYALGACGFASYLKFIWPDIPVSFTAASVIILICGIAILNIRTNVWITGIFLAVEMVALVIMAVVAGATPVRSIAEVVQNPEAMTAGVLGPASIGTLALASISGAFATVGGNQAINFGEEMRHPHRDMGWVILSACLVGAVFIAGPMILVCLSAGDLGTILNADVPLSAFLAERASPAIAAFVSFGVATAIFNSLLAISLQQGRFIFSLSRDGLWSKSVNELLCRIHPRFQSPWTATIAFCSIGLPLCFLPERVLLVLVSSSIVIYLGNVSLGVLIGHYRKITGDPNFSAPLYPLFPWAGIALAIIFAVADIFDTGAGLPSLLLYAAVAFGAWIYYVRVASKRQGGWRVTKPDLT
jgi:amino acid transporter